MADAQHTPRPRVLLVTRNLPPLRGGMERLNLHMAQALAEWSDLTVIGPTGCGQFLPAQCEVIEVPVRPLSAFLVRSLWAAWRRAGRPMDIALAGSGLTAISVKLAAWRAGARSVAYVHGLDLLVPHRLYRAVWLPCLRRLDQALANSANTADIAARCGVAGGRIRVIHPGVTLPGADDDPADAFRTQHQLGQRPLLLSVGRLTARKGLSEFIRHALPAIQKHYPDVILVVIGDDAPDALAGAGTGGRAALQALAAELGLSANLRLLGPCDDKTLTQAYFAADVHVFPVRDMPGDVEGFGMVAIEAAAHGLPTVAFAVGGVPDAVSPGHSGHLVQPGDYAGFAQRTSQLLAAGRDAPLRASAREFAQAFRWQRFGERLHAALAETIDPAAIEQATPRRGHAVLDLRSRSAKARKIEALLDLQPTGRPLRLLEVGTGSGGIAHYFGTHPGLRCEVDAVDVTDSRQIHDGYRFTRVNDVQLPFPDGHFDVAISNHVIEHVGDCAAQRRHLAELRRVLRPAGVGYLAVPSRWQVVEPHYRLAFLSWLPQAWRTPYLRLRRRGSHYDCRPLTVPQVEALLREAGFRYAQQHGRALRLSFELERPQALVFRAFFRHVPDSVYAALRRTFPTLIYTLAPVPGVGDAQPAAATPDG